MMREWTYIVGTPANMATAVVQALVHEMLAAFDYTLEFGVGRYQGTSEAVVLIRHAAVDADSLPGHPRIFTSAVLLLAARLKQRTVYLRYPNGPVEILQVPQLNTDAVPVSQECRSIPIQYEGKPAQLQIYEDHDGALCFSLLRLGVTCTPYGTPRSGRRRRLQTMGTEVYVVVERGIVRDVYVSDPQASVVVIDHDTYGDAVLDESNRQWTRELEQKTEEGKLYMVY